MKLAILLLFFAAPVFAQDVTVVTVAHSRREVPTGTSCSVSTYNVDCRDTAVYHFTEVVRYNGQNYTISRRAAWRWSAMDELADGYEYKAKIDGKHMTIYTQRGGNQGKEIKMTFDILDIR